MKYLIYFIVMLSLFAGSLQSHPLDKINWVSESYPPYNYISQDGRAKGLSVEILEAMWETVGFQPKKKIAFYSWARGMLTLQREPETCLFAMARSAERENDFYFIGKISGGYMGIFGPRHAKWTFQSIGDVNRQIGRGRIGLVRNDYGEKIFVRKGGLPDRLHRVVRGYQLVKMLNLKRLDLIITSDITFFQLLKNDRQLAHKYRMFLPLEGHVFWGYGFSKKTDPQVLQIMEKAYLSLRRDGRIKKIMKRYRANF